MSAHAAQACELQNSKRAPEAQPVTKLDAFDRVRALICDGELLHIDMNVVQCLGQITDKETGAARAELATIAERIGRSRATVVRSVRRLIDAGVTEREEQRRGKRCFASLYRLVDPVALMGATVAPFSETEKGAKRDLIPNLDDTDP